MNDIKVFENSQFGEIRTVMVNGDPWFVASDVCKALELGSPSKAIERLDEDEKGMNSIHTLGGSQLMSVVNESGLYSLVLGSRKKEAAAFKRWITHEVLPSIRSHGIYATPDTIERMLGDPDTMIAVLTELKRERAERVRLADQAEQDYPKVLFADSVSASNSTILIGELAKLLKQNGVDIGQNRLFQTLRDDGYLIKRVGTDYNAPTQKSMEMGLFRVKETVVTHADGHCTVSKTTKVTGKGQVYFVNRYRRG